VDIKELGLIRKQFRAKYGKKFDDAALQNEGGIVNERIVSKLSVHPPAAYLVHTYLEKICEQFEVDWKPTIKLTGEQLIEPMVAPVGFSVPVAHGSGLGAEALTGQPNIDQEIGYNKPEPDAPPRLPPVAPGQNLPPVAPGQNLPSVAQGQSYGGPVVNATPYIPSADDNESKPTTATVTSIQDDYKDNYKDNAYDEVDIYVPQIPPASVNGFASTIATNEEDNKKDDDDQDDYDDQKPPAEVDVGGKNAVSPDASHMTTYSELAARFESLGK